jgi:orotate phosphoribosyltransferase
MISAAQETERSASASASASFFVMTVTVTGSARSGWIVYYRVDMEQNHALSLFRRAGAYLEGHFRLSSGLHSTGYMQSALVLSHPGDAEAFGRALAAGTKALAPTVVLSPALGGIIIGHEVARALGVPAVFAERGAPPAATLSLRRGFALTPADRVLVVEDVLTTGGSTRETMEVAREAGAQVVGAAAIVDRSGGTIDLGLPYKTLITMSLPTYDPAECPLCKEGVPVTKPGSRPEP